MKKVAIVLAVLLVLFSLCGCENTYHFNYEQLQENVQTIEIIEYNAYTEEESVLLVISEAEQEQLLLDLSQLEYHYFLGAPYLETGKCLKLTYKDNDYEIVSWRGSTKDKRIKCNEKLFEEMIQKYLPK